MIPVEYSCEGANISPQLSWSGGPDAPGYALVFTDQSNGLIHWILWDIAGDSDLLTEDVDPGYMPADVPGARQSDNYAGMKMFAGPCPPNMHNYEFVLYAVDELPLPGLDMSSSRTELEVEIMAHSLAQASLQGTFTPS
jgi:Raf kinase inhibitor-like YbhB/YbcL family protein